MGETLEAKVLPLMVVEADPLSHKTKVVLVVPAVVAERF